MTLQPILGKNYKWWYVLTFYYKSNNSSRLNSIGYLISAILSSAILILIWSTSKQILLSEIFTYILIGRLFFINLHFSNDLLQDVSNGKITTYMLYPTKTISFYLVRDLGWNSFIQIVNIFLTVGVLVLLNNLVIFSSLTNFGIFILFLPITYLLQLFTEILFGSIAFYLPWGWGILSLSSDISNILSGSRFPLSLFNFTIPLLVLFPAFSYHHPMQIYLGKYSQAEILQTFIGGIIWCLVLFILARIVFKIGLKRNEAVGL